MAEADFNQLVRIVNVDLDGNKSIFYALTRIRGLSYSFSNIVLKLAGIERSKKTGYLTEQEIKKITEIIENPIQSGIPRWMLNRRKDYETGADRHIITGDIKFIQTSDIRRMQKIKSRRGMRHQAGLPVRGQRTRSNFRTGTTIGVKRKTGAKKRGKT
ncbi:30S ribosomal protein S13 [Candidatus Woesearchaeota archaeon]|nr:30S ribosomal protein S13 [Candidatus Woesearchaeota archaeon]